MTRKALPAAIALAVVLAAAPASAQIDFSGGWVLDRDISGDLTHASFEPAQQTQNQRTPGGLGGGIGGVGFGGRRRGGGGGGRQQSGANDNPRGGAITAEERARIREIADYVKTLTSMIIEHSDHSTFTVTDGQGRSRLFTTDGKPAEHAFATATIDSTMFNYILVPATHQMALRIALDESGRPRADVPELRLVYKMKTPQTASPKSD